MSHQQPVLTLVLSNNSQSKQFGVKLWWMLSFLLMLMFPPSVWSEEFELPGEFLRTLQDHDLVFSFPMKSAFMPLKPSPNPDMAYDFALKSRTGNLEIRYAIRDFLQSDGTELPPGEMFTVVVLNTSSDRFHKEEDLIVITKEGRRMVTVKPGFRVPMREIPGPDARKFFNADWAAMISYRPRSSFSRDFEVCMALATYKKRRGMTFTFFLLRQRDDDATKKQVAALWNALRYR